MHVESPLPRALSLLFLVLPFVFLVGRDLAYRLTRDRLLRIALAPGFALAVWLLSVHVLGLLTRSFFWGLLLGTLSVPLGALGLRLLRRRDFASNEGSVGRRPPGWAFFLVLLLTLPIARIAFGWGFHDEDLITGHMSIGAQIQNDIYPPRHLTFADVPLRYHYGFNLFTACIGALCRTPSHVSIDIASVLLWPYAAWLLFTLGEYWFGRGRGPVAMLMTLFAGGLPVCLLEHRPFRATDLVGFCSVEGTPMLAPFPSIFFQHPWALGLPMAMAALLVFSARDRCRAAPRFFALLLLFAVLSLSHVVLFVTVLSSVVAAEIWFAYRRRSLRGVFFAVALALGSVVVAAALGGATLGAAGAASDLAWTAGITKHLSSLPRWHLQSYGLAIPLGLLGVLFVPGRARVAMLLLVVGSLFVLNTLHYAHSFDIVKFGSVAAIAMGLSAAALVSRVLDARRGRRFAVRMGLVFSAALLVASVSSAGFTFTGFFFWEGARRFFGVSVPTLAPDEARAASFLRGRMRPGEIVFRRKSRALGFAQWAGLPIPWLDWGVAAFGFSEARMNERNALLTSLPASPDEYLAQGIDWFVLDRYDTRLQAHADRWIAAGFAVDVEKFGELRVVKLGVAR